MYCKNDKVSHPGHGACEISGICEQDFTGTKREYYRLVPFTESGAVVYVPVGKADDIGLRALISETEANQLLDSLSGAEEQWLSDAMAKQHRYKALFSSNEKENLYEMMSAMGALVRRKMVKELGSVDKAMLSTIQHKVMSEIALAKGISFSAAIRQAEEIITTAG